MTPKRLIIDDAIPYADAIFGHLGDIHLMPGRDIDAESVKNADALIVRSRTQVNQNLLQGSSVKFVGSTVVGLDHIDQAWLSQQGIHFYSAQGCNANSVAEYIISGLLQLAEDDHFDLRQQTLGIIGVGQVGRLVLEKAKALGIDCLINDPPRAQNEGQTGFTELNELLTQADIITVHTPLKRDGAYPTLNLLNRQNLRYLKPDAIIINAARGGIIDEAAWIDTETRANLIDCWQDEPYINPVLYQKADYATPHIAGHSLEAKINGSTMVYQQLCQFWNIEPQAQWQTHLPPAPAPLKVPETNNWQNDLWQIVRQAYDLTQDDKAIRSEQIEQVHKKFEFYRRHYPIRREWRFHRVAKTGSSALNQSLQALGFVLD
jgi:erythronate-4-phosphate dehydrogenase